MNLSAWNNYLASKSNGIDLQNPTVGATTPTQPLGDVIPLGSLPAPGEIAQLLGPNPGQLCLYYTCGDAGDGGLGIEMPNTLPGIRDCHGVCTLDVIATEIIDLLLTNWIVNDGTEGFTDPENSFNPLGDDGVIARGEL